MNIIIKLSISAVGHDAWDLHKPGSGCFGAGPPELVHGQDGDEPSENSCWADHQVGIDTWPYFYNVSMYSGDLNRQTFE